MTSPQRGTHAEQLGVSLASDIFLLALDAQRRTARTILHPTGSQVICNSLFDSVAHRVSLPHPSTGNRDVVFTELAYLLSRPKASVSDHGVLQQRLAYLHLSALRCYVLPRVPFQCMGLAITG